MAASKPDLVSDLLKFMSVSTPIPNVLGQESTINSVTADVWRRCMERQEAIHGELCRSTLAIRNLSHITRTYIFRDFRPGNPERGWNDPPMFGFNSRPSQPPGGPKRLLNKRVAFPATNLPPPGHAVLSPSEGPPPGKTKIHDASAGIPIPKVIQAAQVGNSALPPALQVVTTAVADQDAPLSPVLLPPSVDASMPVTVPVLVPAIVDPVKPQPGQCQVPAVEDERLADLLSRLHLEDDSQLLAHVMAEFGTVMDRYCKMLTEKACEDIRRKLQTFEDKWKKGSLTEAVKVKISHLATALLHEEVDKANHLHLALMVDHIAEVNQWMMGVKKLIQQQQLFLKEKELSSGNMVISGHENNPIDNGILDSSVGRCDGDRSVEQNSAVDNAQETVVDDCDNSKHAEGNMAVNESEKQTVNEEERTDMVDKENLSVNEVNEENPVKAETDNPNLNADVINENDQGANESVDSVNTKCDNENNSSQTVKDEDKEWL